MLELAGPLAIVSATLAVGGAFKLRTPAPTQQMMRSLGLPASVGVVRGSGAVEVAVGSLGLVFGGVWAALAVAALFVVFTVMMARLVLMGDEAASCGCFGTLSARPSWLHVGADATCAAVAAGAALLAAPGVLGVAGELGPAGTLAFGLLVAVGTIAVVGALTALPEAMEALRVSKSGEAPAPTPVMFSIGRKPTDRGVGTEREVPRA